MATRYPKVDVKGKKFELLWETTVEEYESRADFNSKRHAELLRQAGEVSALGLRKGSRVIWASRRADGSIKLPCAEGG